MPVLLVVGVGAVERWEEIMRTTLKMCRPEMDGWMDEWKDGWCRWIDVYIACVGLIKSSTVYIYCKYFRLHEF